MFFYQFWNFSNTLLNQKYPVYVIPAPGRGHRQYNLKTESALGRFSDKNIKKYSIAILRYIQDIYLAFKNFYKILYFFALHLYVPVTHSLECSRKNSQECEESTRHQRRQRRIMAFCLPALIWPGSRKMAANRARAPGKNTPDQGSYPIKTDSQFIGQSCYVSFRMTSARTWTKRAHLNQARPSNQKGQQSQTTKLFSS